uniref:Fork-head domain-containing protein n=1 Tax=Eptatretus burgeri TaxID=7764 RepID=A0A8C4Q7V5_EPTBU
MGQAMPLHKKLEPSAMLLPSSLPHRYIEAGVAESVLLLNGQACTYPQGFLSAGEQLAAGLGCSYLGLPFGVGVSGTSCLDSLGLCYPPSVLGHSTPLATSPLSPGCLLAGGGFLHDGLFCGYPEEALHWACLSKRQGANLESIALSAEDDDSAAAKEHNNRRHSAHPPSAVSPLSPKNGGSFEDSKESNVSSYIKCWGEGLRSSCPWVSKAEWPQDNKQAPSESVYSSCLNRSFPEAALEVAMRQVSKEGVDKGVFQQASKDSISEKVVDPVKKECPKGRTALSRYTKLGRSYPGSALSKALREARSDMVNKPLHWSKDNALPTSKEHGKEMFSKKVDGVITQSLQHQDNQILGNSKLAEDKEEDDGDRHKMCTKIVCDDVRESATSPADFPFAPSEDIPRQNHPVVQADAPRESHRSKRLCPSLGTEAKMSLSQSCLDGSLSEALQKAGEPRGGGSGSVGRKRTAGTSKASSRTRGSGRISTGLSRSYPGSTLSKALRRACSAASDHGGSTSCLLASTNSDGGTGASESDEELTNLDWLYEGTNPLHSLSLGHEQGELLRSLSPARDAASTDSSSQIMASPNTARGSATVTGKPPYSFSCLIFLAIEFSPGKRLPVRDIYSWILENFPYFASAPTGWKNSVRHNLSLNKCFRRVEKDRSQSDWERFLVVHRPRVQTQPPSSTQQNTVPMVLACLPHTSCLSTVLSQVRQNVSAQLHTRFFTILMILPFLVFFSMFPSPSLLSPLSFTFR